MGCGGPCLCLAVGSFSLPLSLSLSLSLTHAHTYTHTSRFLSLLDKAGVPHSGFEDAILPAWADKLWPNGADESVTGILRVLPPSLNLGVDQEEILYHGRAPLYKSARRKKRH